MATLILNFLSHSGSICNFEASKNSLVKLLRELRNTRAESKLRNHLVFTSVKCV